MGELLGTLPSKSEDGALEFLVGRLRNQAPAALAPALVYAVALEAAEESVEERKSTVLVRDIKRLKGALAKIKGPCGQMVLRLG